MGIFLDDKYNPVIKIIETRFFLKVDAIELFFEIKIN